jgi:hypothetical protein
LLRSRSLILLCYDDHHALGRSCCLLMYFISHPPLLGHGNAAAAALDGARRIRPSAYLGGGEGKGGEAEVSARVQGARQARGACERVVVCLGMMDLVWRGHKACRTDPPKSVSVYSAIRRQTWSKRPLCRVKLVKGVSCTMPSHGAGLQTHKQAVRQVLVCCLGLDKLPMPLGNLWLPRGGGGRGVSLLPSDTMTCPLSGWGERVQTQLRAESASCKSEIGKPATNSTRKVCQGWDRGPSNPQTRPSQPSARTRAYPSFSGARSRGDRRRS